MSIRPLVAPNIAILVALVGCAQLKQTAGLGASPKATGSEPTAAPAASSAHASDPPPPPNETEAQRITRRVKETCTFGGALSAPCAAIFTKNYAGRQDDVTQEQHAAEKCFEALHDNEAKYAAQLASNLLSADHDDVSARECYRLVTATAGDGWRKQLESKRAADEQEFASSPLGKRAAFIAAIDANVRAHFKAACGVDASVLRKNSYGLLIAKKSAKKTRFWSGTNELEDVAIYCDGRVVVVTKGVGGQMVELPTTQAQRDKDTDSAGARRACMREHPVCQSDELGASCTAFCGS